MIFSAIFIFAIIQSISGQLTSSTTSTRPSTTTTTTPSPEWNDPYANGKYGNPGADIYLSNKSIDQVHLFVGESLGRSIQSMSINDLNVQIGSATLTIKQPRISEAKFANFVKEFQSPNRIRSKFIDGRILASGVWQWKSPNSQRFAALGRAMQGFYRTTIVNGRLESLNQLTRTNDAKPMIQNLDCQANFSQFRVDIEGAGNVSLIENCDDPICHKIRTYFEDAACQVFRTSIVKDLINQKLATFPALIDTYSQNHQINYGLQMNEPKVTENGIEAGLEGEAVWFDNSYIPFNPNSLLFVNRSRMYTFELSDYSFNTLFYHPHSQNYRYSAADLLSKSPSIKDQLKLNCSSKDSKPSTRFGISSGLAVTTRSCLGSIFDNMTNFVDQEQFAWNDTGDFVYKSDRRAPSIIVQSKDRAYFDGSNGVIELYGPMVGQDQKRRLLAKADVRVLRGEFMPNFNGANISGSIRVTELEFGQSAMQTRSIGDQWLIKLQQFAHPLLTEMFNVFLSRYAQFSIPLLDDFQCASPDFVVSSRTMQIDCDIRYVGKQEQKPNRKQ